MSRGKGYGVRVTGYGISNISSPFTLYPLPLTPYLLPLTPPQSAFQICKYLLSFLLFLYLSFNAAFAFSFAVLGDNRDGDEVFNAIIREINNDKEINFVVNTGDLTPLSREKEYKKYSDTIKKSRAKFYNVIGNHDIKFRGKEYFKAFFGPRYYSWDFIDDKNNCHFIVLDNVSQRGLGKEQYAWLVKDLEENKSKKNFVFMHRPIFDVSGSFPDEVMYPKRVGKELIKLFEKNNVKMAFWGHIHGYGKGQRNGITYILTGGAGAPLYLPYFSGGYHHYVKVTVDGEKIKEEVIEIE